MNGCADAAQVPIHCWAFESTPESFGSADTSEARMAGAAAATNSNRIAQTIHCLRFQPLRDPGIRRSSLFIPSFSSVQHRLLVRGTDHTISQLGMRRHNAKNESRSPGATLASPEKTSYLYGFGRASIWIRAL